MRRVLAVTLLIGAAMAVPRLAAAAALSCCGCVNLGSSGLATTSQLAPLPVAAFCAGPVGPVVELSERCDDFGPTYQLVCVPDDPGPSCAQQLATEEAIICPQVGAPVAGTSGLAALIAALGGLGAWTVGRRMRRGRG